MSQLPNSLELLPGGSATDDRGRVTFFNELPLGDFKRQYFVRNHSRGFIRAWHGHAREGKAVIVVSGTAIVCAVKVDNWDDPDPSAPVARYVLTEQSPSVLFIPPGYANGFMTLTDATVLQFLSTSTLQESLEDDTRFGSRFWDPWTIAER